MPLALGHRLELNHCGLINGLIGLVATAVFRDIVALTMKIELVVGWVGGLGGGGGGAGRQVVGRGRGM